MKLFLCGGGSNTQIIFALKKFKSVLKKDRPILYIPLAMKKENYKSCKKWFSKEIKYIGSQLSPHWIYKNFKYT